MPEWSGFRKKKDGPQQGTLFDVRQIPSEPVNSPGMRKRGRRAEMMAAMPPTASLPLRQNVDFDWLEEDRDHEVVTEKIFQRNRKKSDYGDEHTMAEERAVTSQGERLRADMAHRLADRTTVPAEALSGLRRIKIGYDHDDAPDPYFDSAEVAHYDRRAGAIRSPAVLDTATFTHEIGHHVSANTPGYSERQSARAKDPRGGTVGPREEAFADDYAATHADPRYSGYGGDFLADNPVYQESRKVPPAPSGSGALGRQFEQLTAFDPEVI